MAERSKARVCGGSLAGITGLNSVGGMDVSVVSVVLSGRGLCGGPIPRPEESYRVWCATVRDLRTSRMRRPWPALGCIARGRKYNVRNYMILKLFLIICNYMIFIADRV